MKLMARVKLHIQTVLIIKANCSMDKKMEKESINPIFKDIKENGNKILNKATESTRYWVQGKFFKAYSRTIN